jgi:hypothetical protein
LPKLKGKSQPFTPPVSAASLAAALPRSPRRARRHSSESIAQRGGVGAGNGEQIYVGVAIFILFWRTDRWTGVAAVEGRRRRDGTDWLFSGVTEGHSRSEQNKEDYEQARDFHLVSPCRSGG